MIWTKTEAGRAEMQAKALIKERAQRNLLLLIDGQKTEEMLLANVAGISADDFTTLETWGLIEPVFTTPGRSTGAPRGTAAAAAPAATPVTAAPLAPAPEPRGYGHFTQTLTQLISKELGLRGFTLTLALEKAGSIEELTEVANRVLEQIRERKGLPAAEAARRALYGE